MYSRIEASTVTASISAAAARSTPGSSGASVATCASGTPLSWARRIAVSSAGSGYRTTALNRKRSSCASGNGYVPSYSTGFCVASTRNGSGSGCAAPSSVTCRSCIASSSADCVFAGARFTSSASTTLPKIGPRRIRNCPVESSYTEVPTTSLGMRSGVNWIRLNVPPMSWATVRASSVFAVPGTPSMRTWPPSTRAM